MLELNDTLKSLNMKRNLVADAGAEHLADGLTANRRLIEVNLSGEHHLLGHIRGRAPSVYFRV
eukprot:4060797-Pyramimonas_sp.AAC.2